MEAIVERQVYGALDTDIVYVGVTFHNRTPIFDPYVDVRWWPKNKYRKDTCLDERLDYMWSQFFWIFGSIRKNDVKRDKIKLAIQLTCDILGHKLGVMKERS